MRAVRGRLAERAEEFKSGSLRGIRSGQIWAYGVFDNSIFEGTDKLSMCVINDAIEHVRALQQSPQRHVLLIEGDRLFCDRFLRASAASVIVIDASETELRNRHKLRKDRQTEARLRACRTKVENFCRRHKVIRVFNNTRGDFTRIVDQIVRIASEYTDEPIQTSNKV